MRKFGRNYPELPHIDCDWSDSTAQMRLPLLWAPPFLTVIAVNQSQDRCSAFCNTWRYKIVQRREVIFRVNANSSSLYFCCTMYGLVS